MSEPSGTHREAIHSAGKPQGLAVSGGEGKAQMSLTLDLLLTQLLPG